MSLMIAERPKHKARARAADEARLKAGEISASDLQRENMPFRGLREDRISFIPKSRSKGRQRYLAV